MRGRLGTLGVLGSKPVYRTMYIQLRLPPGGKGRTYEYACGICFVRVRALSR